MKTIGVLGGLGPQATVEFEALVHTAAQRLLPQTANAGYPPMLVAYHRGPLIELGPDDKPVIPLRPARGILETAGLLGRCADFLVVISNGAHRFQREIEEAAGKPVLGMTDLVLAEAARRGWRSVGVLTFLDPGVYAEPLRTMGLRCETIGPDLQAPLDAAILQVMEGRNDATSVEAAARAVQELRTRGVDGIILGCTEIPYLVPTDAQADDAIDPLPILAEAAVRRAAAAR